MIRVKASPGEVEIEAPQHDYSRLARLFVDFLTASDPLLEIDCDAGYDPAPYATALSSIRLKLSSGPILFDVESSSLTLTGSSSALSNFVGNFPTYEVSAGPVPYHIHYDVISFPDFVAEGSPDVVLTLRGTGS